MFIGKEYGFLWKPIFRFGGQIRDTGTQTLLDLLK